MSRFYLNHRYSDDLDFFVNDDSNYLQYIEKIYEALSANYYILSDKIIRSASFVRLILKENDTLLQLDFVNDIPYRVGEPIKHQSICLIDTWQNILSNKLTALTRLAAKDIADIVFIANKYQFSWQEMIAHAQNKAGGLSEKMIYEILTKMPEQELNKVVWIKKPNFKKIMSDINIIAQDIIYGRENSLI